MKTYFTADTHFQHEHILGMTARNFANIEEHDAAILDGINSTVGRDDRLFILGDFAWRAEESHRAKIQCRYVHFVIGNHDRAKAAKLFTTAEDTTLVKIQTHKVFLSHYPHAYWPASHHGSLHLYGHTHDQREATLDACFPGRRSMDVGIDPAWRLLGARRPFSEDEVLAILLARPGHDPVEWYAQFNKDKSGAVHEHVVC